MKRKQSAPRRVVRRIRRRGVILIVVVGLMALFALVGITFVITAEQANRAAQTASEVERYEDPPETLLNRALLQVLVGTRNRFSAIGPNSLLEDMYGPGAEYTLTATTFVFDNPDYSVGNGGVGGMIYFRYLPLGSTPGTFPRAKDYFTGCVITMTTGPLAGKSSRITGYDSETIGTDTFGRLRLLPFPGMQLTGSRWSPAPGEGDRCVINSRPFNGTGAGYRPVGFDGSSPATNYSETTGLLDAVLLNASNARMAIGGVPLTAALMLNPRDPDVQRYITRASSGSFNALHLDEDYDAPDYQNIHLALRGTTFTRLGSPQTRIIPSYHRPEVVDYWASVLGGAFGKGVRRKIQLRPLNDDHPGFESVNPNFPNEWDVDNDGDGVKDSVWLDLGFDVQSDSQGRLYKPLVALHIIDLDGRVNLNAHGQLNEYFVDPAPLGVTTNVAHSNHKIVVGAVGALAGSGGSPVLLPAGSGMSPADVNPMAVFALAHGTAAVPGTVVMSGTAARPNFAAAAPDDSATTDFNRLLFGRIDGSRTIAGRYGEPHLLTGTSGVFPAPGATFPRPGRSDTDDARSDDNWPPDPSRAFQAIPGRSSAQPFGNAWAHDSEGAAASLPAATPPGLGSVMGSPVDPDGNGTIAVDALGQPAFANTGLGGSEFVNEAYELNLFDKAGYEAGARVSPVDAPFTPEDLDWLLRPYDVGMGSDRSRLASLMTDRLKSNAYCRGLLTTESWDVPCPSLSPTAEIASGLAQLSSGTNVRTLDLSFADLVRGKLKHVNSSWSINQVDTALGYLQNCRLIAPEVNLGLRMNVNRPFGNNAADRGNQIVDNAVGDAAAGTDELATATGELVWGSVPVDRNGDGAYDWGDRNGDGNRQRWELDHFARVLYAQQLYMLAMLVMDTQYGDPSDDPQLSGSGTSNAAHRREMAVRRVAQWAVNAVDFRDQDHIITGMEFDLNPFTDDDGDGNPWDVDGDLETAESTSDRAVVWGCETPLLLLTESVAFHDLRITDASVGGGKTTDDSAEDPDQARIPQGSAFVELYCPVNHNLNSLTAYRPSGDFFATSGANVGKLDLAKMAPASGGAAYPVWRLAFSKTHWESNAPDNSKDPLQAQVENWDTASLEPRPWTDTLNPANPASTTQPHGWSNRTMLTTTPVPSATPVEIDRIVWFSSASPNSNHNDRERIYRRTTTVGDPHLGGGEYAVVGPYRDPDYGGAVTRIGYRPVGSDDVQKIDLDHSGMGYVKVGANDGTLPNAQNPYNAIGTRIRDPLGIPCQWDALHDNPTGTSLGAIGFSISEPRPSLTAGTFDLSSYYDTTSGLTVNPDYPDNFGPTDRYMQPQDTLEDNLKGPLKDAVLEGVDLNKGVGVLGTKSSFATVFLQRLADPTRPWSANVNPYLTVDAMPIDLTVYNSESAKWSDDPASEAQNTNSNINFSTRQRGGDDYNPTTPAAALNNDDHFNLWSPIFGVANPRPTATAAAANFGYNLSHTLGYINHTYHAAGGNPWVYGTSSDYGGYTSNVVGAPRRAFNVLPWLNRPFVSAMELLLVPASAPSRLYHEYDSYIGGTGPSYYRERTVADAANGRASYGYLLNFFFSASAKTSVSPPPTGMNFSNPTTQHDTVDDVLSASSNLYAVFEYLGVPSRFSGSHQMLPPSVYQAGGAHKYVGEFEPFYAPHNLLPTYREPGRVNINAIMDALWDDATTNTPDPAEDPYSPTWAAVTNFYADRATNGSYDYPPDGRDDVYTGDETYTAGWRAVRRSRQGFGGNVNLGANSAESPTHFANPFRTFSARHWVPEISSALQDLRDEPAGATRLAIDATFLRRLRNNSGTIVARPLFSFNSDSGLRSGATGIETLLGDYNDSNRNPYFSLEPLIKLNNILTTRSNVYAVWATIGYFEVERAIPGDTSTGTPLGANVPALDDANFDGTVDANDFWTIYPDGYTYKGELGADTGEIKRHRGFWIVDRTIPVGFERGEAHNAMDAVILQRVLE